MSGRSLRACLVCSYIQTHSRFVANGCPNCERFLEMSGDSNTVSECTSEVYEGVIVLMKPERSWVAKWQRLDGYVDGQYAIKVDGLLPDEYVNAAENAGVKYIPRDGSANDEQ